MRRDGVDVPDGSIHDVAASGFSAEAEAYERSRPSYPPDAVAWITEHLRVGPGTRVADVAAGTGKLTRLLEPTGAEVLAVEPVPEMLGILHRSSPAIPTVAATAERLALADGCLDAITVAQAFHWFEALRALREFHRVLRPGGRVALVWNARDRSVPWVDEVWQIMDRVEQSAPWRDHDNWRDTAFVENPWFGTLAEAQFAFEQELDHEGVVDRLRSVSHVAARAPDEQEAVFAEVRAVLARHPGRRLLVRAPLTPVCARFWSPERPRTRKQRRPQPVKVGAMTTGTTV
jgi:SAM-dependent methyltransferase